MKTIGLIGGMSWESAQLYYQFINRKVKQQLGGLNSDKVMINSVNFAEIAEYQQQNRRQDAGEVLAESAKKFQSMIDDLTAPGAQGIILGCTELVLLTEQLDLNTAIFDSAQIHAEVAVNLALGHANFSDFSAPKTPTTMT